MTVFDLEKPRSLLNGNKSRTEEIAAVRAIIREIIRQKGCASVAEILDKVCQEKLPITYIHDAMQTFRGEGIWWSYSGDGAKEVTVQGHKLHLHPLRGDVVSNQINNDLNGYDPAAVQVIEKFVRRGQSVVDVGANLGFHTTLFARAVGPTGHVVAFEPEASNFLLLQKNILANKYANVQAVMAAVMNRAGYTTLRLSASNFGDHRSYLAEEARPFVYADAVDLTSFFEDSPKLFDVVKIDIQGCEILALIGAVGFLSKQPRMMLMIEYWPHGLRSYGFSSKVFSELVKELGFDLIYESKVKDNFFCMERVWDLPSLISDDKDWFADLVCFKGWTEKEVAADMAN